MTNQTSSEQGVLLEMMTARDDAQRVAGRLTVELERAYMQIESQKVMQRGLEKQILNLREGLPEPMCHRTDVVGYVTAREPVWYCGDPACTRRVRRSAHEQPTKPGHLPPEALTAEQARVCAGAPPVDQRGPDPPEERAMYGAGVPDLDDRPDEDIPGQSSPDVDQPDHLLTAEFKKVWDTIREFRDKADAHERDTEVELKSLGHQVNERHALHELQGHALHELTVKTARLSGRLDDFCGGGGGVKQAVRIGISEVLGREIDHRLVSVHKRLKYELQQWVIDQVKPQVWATLEDNIRERVIAEVKKEVAKRLEPEAGKIKELVTGQQALVRWAHEWAGKVGDQIGARDHAEVAALGQDAAAREAASGEASNVSEAPH